MATVVGTSHHGLEEEAVLINGFSTSSEDLGLTWCFRKENALTVKLLWVEFTPGRECGPTIPVHVDSLTTGRQKGSQFISGLFVWGSEIDPGAFFLLASALPWN